MLQLQHKVQNVGPVHVPIPDALVHGVAQHIPVDDQHIELAVVESLEGRPPVHGEPQGHAPLVHVAGGDPVLFGEIPAHAPAEETAVVREGQDAHPEPPRFQPRPQRFHLYALAGAVDALKGDDLRFAHVLLPRVLPFVFARFAPCSVIRTWAAPNRI